VSERGLPEAPLSGPNAGEPLGSDAASEKASDPGDEATTTAPEGEFARFVVVEVSSVTFALPSASPVVHLRETEPPYRDIEFPVGLTEAQAIAMAIEGETAPRPGTHDLLAAVLAASGSEIVAVRIVAEHVGTLHAELDVMTPRGREVLDCRPSDGLAVALRQVVVAPILCDEAVLER